MRSKSLGELLEQSDQGNSLITHANLILDLRKALAQVLPGNLARHCSIANFKNGKLVVFANNSAIAAKLKLLATGLPRQISEQLKQGAGQVTAVSIEVQPSTAPGPAPPKSTFLTPAGAEAIRTLSTQVTDNKLKNVLVALASRGRK